MTNEIAKQLRQSFVWQTFPNTPNANRIRPERINGIYCSTNAVTILGWRSTDDHSKIGISFAEGNVVNNDGWVCIGDLNRHYSQVGRGGGFACAQLAGLNALLGQTIRYENCPP